MDNFKINDVIQFTENHKWCGCLGIIEDIKQCGDDIKYLINMPWPSGSAYIFSMKSEHDFEYIGKAIMIKGDTLDD